MLYRTALFMSVMLFLGAGCTLPKDDIVVQPIPAVPETVQTSEAQVFPVAAPAPVTIDLTPSVLTPPITKQPASVVSKPVVPAPAPVVVKPVVQPVTKPPVVVVPPVAPAPVVVAPPFEAQLFTESQFTLHIPTNWQGGDNKVWSSADASQYFYYAVIDINQMSSGARALILSGDILALEQDGIAHRCNDGSGCPTMTSHETVTIGGATGLHWTVTASTGAHEEWYMLIKGNMAYRFWMSQTIAVFPQILATFQAK